MKKILLFALILMLSYCFAKADCDTEGCDDPEWTLDTLSWNIPGTDCWIWAKFEYRTVTCDDVEYFELRVIGAIAAIDQYCGDIENVNTLMETIYSHLFLSQYLPITYPTPGTCISTFRVSGPACWELVYRQSGPYGAGHYLSPCAANPKCCRHYKICNHFGILSLIPLSYTPVPCGAIIGPESNLPCFSNCQ
jgi:hypothetical protein